MDQRSVLKDSLGMFLRNLWDLMILNFLWLLCSLPLITLGPATCGLYRVALKLARKEAVYPVKDFFRAFRDGLKQGTVLGLLAPVGLLLLLPPIALQMLGFMYIILGVSGPVYACCHILRDLFDKVANAAVQ